MQIIPKKGWLSSVLGLICLAVTFYGILIAISHNQITVPAVIYIAFGLVSFALILQAKQDQALTKN